MINYLEFIIYLRVQQRQHTIVSPVCPLLSALANSPKSSEISMDSILSALLFHMTHQNEWEGCRGLMVDAREDTQSELWTAKIFIHSLFIEQQHIHKG